MAVQIDRRRLLMLGTACVPVLLGACSLFGRGKSSSGADALLHAMVADLGISPTQALGGTGALMNVAKNSPAAGNFGAVSSAVSGRMTTRQCHQDGGWQPTDHDVWSD